MSNYSEHIPLPLIYRVFFANLFAVGSSFILYPAAFIFRNPSIYVLVLGYLALTVLLFIVMTISMGIRIKVRPERGFKGKIDRLHVRGNSKYSTYITCRDITDIKPVEYQPSGWRTFFLGGARTDHAEGYAIVQTGYRGSGLSITYISNPLIGAKSTATVQFPTRRPEELTARLKDYLVELN